MQRLFMAERENRVRQEVEGYKNEVAVALADLKIDYREVRQIFGIADDCPCVLPHTNAKQLAQRVRLVRRRQRAVGRHP